MAAITRTKENISQVHTHLGKVHGGIAATAIEAGQPVYVDSNGKYALADANGSGTDKFRGIALETVGAGQPLGVLVEGFLEGFTLAGAYDSAAYVSDSVGELADAAGTTSLVVGKVMPFWKANGASKVLYVTGFAG